jgi:hypothetical protein
MRSDICGWLIAACGLPPGVFGWSRQWVWLFAGLALINSLTLGTFGALPAPAEQIATAVILTVGGLLVACW